MASLYLHAHSLPSRLPSAAACQSKSHKEMTSTLRPFLMTARKQGWQIQTLFEKNRVLSIEKYMPVWQGTVTEGGSARDMQQGCNSCSCTLPAYKFFLHDRIYSHTAMKGSIADTGKSAYYIFSSVGAYSGGKAHVSLRHTSWTVLLAALCHFCQHDADTFSPIRFLGDYPCLYSVAPLPCAAC